MEFGARHIVGGLVLIIGAVAYFAWQEQDRERAELSAARTPAAAAERNAEQVVIYKWQDDAGTWNFTERPPTDGRPFSEIRGTPNVTTVPTVVPETGPAIQSGPAGTDGQQETSKQ